MKYTLALLLIAACALAKSQPVCVPAYYETNRGFMNVWQVRDKLQSRPIYWYQWAKIDCPPHVYEISQRDKTEMPDCYILITRAIEPPKLPVVPKLVSYRKKYNGA